MAILTTGDVVTIGEDQYVITDTPEHACSCTICQVQNCAYNDDMKAFRKRYNTLTCERIIGLNKHFTLKSKENE